MACDITYKGKTYSYEQFASMLHDGLLDELIKDGTINPDTLSGKPGQVGVKNAYVEPRRKALKLEDIERGKVSDEELSQETERIFKEDPGYVIKRIQQIADGAKVNDLDQYLVSKYLADIEAKLLKNPSPELVNEFDRVSKISTILMGTETARALAARKKTFDIEESLGAALSIRKDTLGVESLSKEEISETQKLWEEVQKLKEEVETLKKGQEDAIQRALAEDRLKREKKKNRPEGKYTKAAKKKIEWLEENWDDNDMKFTIKDENGNDQDINITANGISKKVILDIVKKVLLTGGRIADAIVEIRKQLSEKEFFKNLTKKGQDDLVEQIRQRIERKSSGLTDQERNSLSKGLTKENASVIKKLVKEQTDNGIYDLDTIIESVEKIIGLENITKQDVINVIAGKYNEKTTLSEHQRNISELRQEAKALSELESLMKEPVNMAELPMEKRKRIKALKEKVKEFKGAEIDLSKIKAAIKRNENQINKIQEKIDTGNFVKEKRESLKNRESLLKKYPKEREALLDSMAKLNDKRWEFEELYIKDQLANRTNPKKAVDFILKTVNTLSKAKAGIDLSAAGVHGAWLALSHPKLWASSLYGSIKGLSEKEYNRQIAQLMSNEELWHIAKGAKLDIFDVQSMREQEVEGLLIKSWFDKHITKGGKTIDIGKYSFRPFERAFVSMGNNMRMTMFAENIQSLLKQGKTFESHPEDFKRVAMVVNSITGRGKVHSPIFNNALVNTVIWAPRLLKSSLDMIGVSDAFSIGRGAETGYYRAAFKTKEARNLAIKTAARGVITGTLIMAAASLFLGADSDDDPESPTFGWIKFPDGHSWNIFGRYSSIASKIIQIARGEMSIDGQKVEVDSGEKLIKTLRGKLAPLPSMAVDISTGQTFMGEEAEIETTLGRAVVPMSLMSIADEVRHATPASILAAPANFLGLPIYNKASYEETMRQVRAYQARKRKIEYMTKGRR